MGNRQNSLIVSQEMVPQLSINQSEAPLVVSESEHPFLPRTIPVPHVQISCHLLPDTFSLNDDNSFRFTFDSLFDCDLEITSKRLPIDPKGPQPTIKNFKASKGIDQEFRGWILPLGSNEVSCVNELSVKMFCKIPKLHKEISLIRLSKVNEAHEGKVKSQQLEYNGKIYDLKELYGAQQEERAECSVCLTNKRDTVIIPCYHMCLCASCANMLRVQANKKCPICRCGNPYTEADALMKVCE